MANRPTDGVLRHLSRLVEAQAADLTDGQLLHRFATTRDEGAFAALLQRALRAEKPEPSARDIAAAEEFARQAPALVVAVSCPDTASKIPVWEQELSAGAACMNLLNAAHAEGFVGGWLTDWPAFSDTVRAAFAPGGRIAGFIFLGTPGRELQERPRPEFGEVVSEWAG